MLMPEELNPGAYTPFKPDGGLDEKVLAEHLRLVTGGAGGLHGPANHSEYASLTLEEWKAWCDVLVDVAHGAGIKAWPFLGSESFEKTVQQMTYAVDAGADGVVVMMPYFNLFVQEAGYQYYRDLAAEFPQAPIVFYPTLQTGNQLTPATIARIAELPNVVGMKLNGDPSFGEVGQIVMLTKDIDQFRLMTGSLTLLYPLLKGIDIKTSCSGMSNFAPEWSLNLWDAYRAKDWPTVEHWQKKITRIAAAMNIAGDRRFGAKAGHKAALGLLGRPVGLPRRPGLPATEDQIARIRKVFQEEGLL